MHNNSPSLADGALGLELVQLGGRLDDVLPVGDGDGGTAVDIGGGDVLIGVERVVRLDGHGMGTTSSGGVNGKNRLELGVGGVVARGTVRHVGERGDDEWVEGGN